MNFTFRLKEPKSNKETLIYFRSYFNKERKTFIYSTGEKIDPKDWDFDNHRVIGRRGQSSHVEKLRTTQKQLNRYSDYFIEIVNRYKNIGDDLNTVSIRKRFDEKFKKCNNRLNFFTTYDSYIQEREADCSGNSISKSTLKRYIYNKNLLQAFQTATKTNLSLEKFDENTYNKFLKFCIENKGHSNNTINRNVSLLKAFLAWCLKKKISYNNGFQGFKKPKKFITDQIALNMEQVREIYEFDFTYKKSLERVRDLFIFGCTTGLRFGNYSVIDKEDIQNNILNVIDNKSKSKNLSIPLNSISKEILEKYDYNLPTISNQKMNKYIKEVFKYAGFTQNIKKTMKYGDIVVEKITPFYERISSHTARRTFITIMKNKRVPDKVIMSYTGHRSLEVFNNYYKPSEEDKINYMNEIFT